MKPIILTFALGALMLSSCNNNKTCNDNNSFVIGNNGFIIGSWTIDNMNTVDSSVNRETLLGTFLATSYADKNILTFSADHTITLTTNDGKESGKGCFNLIDNSTYLMIKFPDDKMESHYQIKDKSDKSIKLTAFDDGETLNILLNRKPY